MHVLLHLATIAGDYTVYAALSLAVPRLGRAISGQPTSANSLTARQRNDLLDAFRIVVHKARFNVMGAVRTKTYLDGQLHSFHDQPADSEGGCKKWYRRGRLHRNNDQPAVDVGHSQLWFHNGVYHRDGDQPAVVCAPDRKEWWQHGRMHRSGGRPAYVTRTRATYFEHGLRIKRRSARLATQAADAKRSKH